MRIGALLWAGVSLVLGVGCQISFGLVLESAGSGDQIVDIERVDDRLVVRDSGSGAVLFEQVAGFGVKRPTDKGDLVDAEVRIDEHPDGFDIVLDYENDARTSRFPAAIWLARFKFGEDAWTFKQAFRLETLRLRASDFNSRSEVYPQDAYSPVVVVGNATHALGVSVQYPLMQYQHDIRLGLVHQKRGPQAGWNIWIDFQNHGSGDRLDALTSARPLAPGESRRYVVSVRWTVRPTEWVRTLEPYRDYFRAMYGGVRYRPDLKNIQGFVLAQASAVSASNPYGYAIGGGRPDVDGWDEIVDRLKTRRGWDAIMMWQATGFYPSGSSHNMPSLFAGPLARRASIRGALDPDAFPAAAAVRDIGLWWGMSAMVHKRWNPGDSDVEPLDPDNPAHRRYAFDQLDIAERAGVTLIGFDAHTHRRTPVWKTYAWIHDLRDRYPRMRFVIEPLGCDVLQTVAGSWVEASEWPDNPRSAEDFLAVDGPHVLADFLLPGRELMGAYRFDFLRREFDRPETAAEVARITRQLAAWGYTPLIFGGPHLTDPSIRPGRSWLSSVPSDLQIPERRWYTPDFPRPDRAGGGNNNNAGAGGGDSDDGSGESTGGSGDGAVTLRGEGSIGGGGGGGGGSGGTSSGGGGGGASFGGGGGGGGGSSGGSSRTITAGGGITNAGVLLEATMELVDPAIAKMLLEGNARMSKPDFDSFETRAAINRMRRGKARQIPEQGVIVLEPGVRQLLGVPRQTTRVYVTAPTDEP